MLSIEVDFDVLKALTALRPSEEVTENDVLRELLKLPPKKNAPVLGDGPAPGEWVTKGVRFPARTQFRAKYKGQTYLARVEGGALVLDGGAIRLAVEGGNGDHQEPGERVDLLGVPVAGHVVLADD